MNKVILIGRLTKDPEMRTTTSGINSTTFTLAVSRNYTNQSGEKDADFINCVAWRKQAENINKFCKKGSQVAVDGRIQTRSYDAQDGSKRYVTEVVADNVTFLGSKNSNGGKDFNDDNASVNTNSSIETTDLTDDPYKDFGEEVDNFVALSEEDLPF